jgi:hypothetical protein
LYLRNKRKIVIVMTIKGHCSVQTPLIEPIVQNFIEDFDGYTSDYAQENVNGPVGPHNIAT